MNIARWMHGAWEPNPGLGDPCTGAYTLVAPDLGDGPQLLATGGNGGEFYRWNGAQWSALPAMVLPFYIPVLRTYDDGSGLSLYAGLSSDPGDPLHGIARWNGAGWEGVGAGMRGQYRANVLALQPFDGSLYAAGEFNTAGNNPANNIARWGCEPPATCPADCDVSGGLDLFDFLCFVNAFNAADPGADCDGSGALDLFDFLCFTNAFNAGC